MKVFIATPIRDYVTAEYAQSLFYAGLDCRQRGIEIVPNIVRNSCFIDVARNVLVKSFLETDCTHLFFIDSDIGYEAHAVAGLVQAGVPVCAGAYRLRKPDGKFAVQIHEPQELKGPWLRADRVATGFMCIERHVIELMAGLKHTCKVSSHGDVPMIFRTETFLTFVGEDYCFCDDYNEIFEEPIWVYPDITFNHDGYVGNLHESLID